MGIDPGSYFTGFGIIESQGEKIIHKDHGVISLPRDKSLPEKLQVLNLKLQVLFKFHRPEETVVEKIFFGKNAESAFKLGHIRGICLQKAIEWKSVAYEYSASSVKKSTTGKGNADKRSVRLMVFHYLNIQSEAREDASDALALAICHAKKRETLRWLKEQRI